MQRLKPLVWLVAAFLLGVSVAVAAPPKKPPVNPGVTVGPSPAAERRARHLCFQYVQAVQAETKTLKIARSTLKADEGPPPTVLPQILHTQKGMVTADTANLKEAQAVLASCIHANGG